MFTEWRMYRSEREIKVETLAGELEQVFVCFIYFLPLRTASLLLAALGGNAFAPTCDGWLAGIALSSANGEHNITQPLIIQSEFCRYSEDFTVMLGRY